MKLNLFLICHNQNLLITGFNRRYVSFKGVGIQNQVRFVNRRAWLSSYKPIPA